MRVLKKIRVLCVLSNVRNNNGVTNCIMNYYNGILKNNIHIDFICLSNVDSKIKTRIKENGSGYYVLPQENSKATESNIAYINKIISENKYNIIHVNIIFSLAFHFLKIAKENGIQIRILHSHAPKVVNTFKNKLRTLRFNWLCNHYATNYIACTEGAGKSVFGNRSLTVIRNAIDTNKYSFNSDSRSKIRSEYNLNEKFVVGTSCRQAKEKNPFFLVDIFEEIHKKNSASVLLWAGFGDLKNSVEAYISEKGLSDSVIMLGNREDMNLIYSAMDVFVLPSLFEGLGMVYIEAQCSGLYCFASNGVFKDTDVTGNISYLSLNDSPDTLAKAIIAAPTVDRNVDFASSVREKGYDLQEESEKLAKYYISCAESLFLGENK